MKVFFFFSILLFSCPLHAQMKKAEEKRAQARKLTLYEKKQRIVEGLSYDLEFSYVNASLGFEMGTFIKNKFSDKGYDSSFNIHEFGWELTKDLRKMSSDKHIRVLPVYWKTKNHETIYIKGALGRWGWKWRQRWKWKRINNSFKRAASKDNFTYGEIKILPGNIGYIEFFDFRSEIEYAKAKDKKIKFKSALKFLSQTNALIIDLRNNLGGSLNMTVKALSYFVAEQYLQTLRYDIRYDSISKSRNYRDTTLYRKIFSTGEVLKKYKEKPIFVLSSKYTFSAGEALTYYFKKTHRARIVGETTAGGSNGHFGGSYGKDYIAIIPRTHLYDEHNKNFAWEGIGIEPHIRTNYEDALKAALDSAKIYMGKDSLKKKIRYYNKSMLKQTINYSTHFVDSLHKYCGDFGPIKIISDSTNLYLKYDIRPPILLIPKGRNHFTCSLFRSIRFSRNDQDEIIYASIYYGEKYQESYRKDK